MKHRRSIVFVGASAAALLVLLGAATVQGSLDWRQFKAASRHGTQNQGQASDGTGASGHMATYNADGSLTDGGAAPTAGTIFGPLYTVGSVSGISGGSHINWTGASLTTLASGALNFTTTNAAGSFNVEGLSISAPATPYSIIMQLIPNIQYTFASGGGNAFAGGGLFWSDGTKFALFRTTGDSTQRFITVNLATATSVGGGGNQTVGPQIDALYGSAGLFLKILDDGTNRKTFFSFDGVNFTQFDTVARTTWLTPTTIGAFLCQSSMIILSWTQGTS